MRSTEVVIETPEGFLTAESEEGAEFIKRELESQRRRAERRRALYPGEGPQQMTALCRSFPSLKESAKGIAPWDIDRFLLWMLRGGGASGCMHAARFVLQVWNGRSDWVGCMRKAFEPRTPDPEDSPSCKALYEGAAKLKREIRADLEECERSDAKEYKRAVRAVSDSAVEKVIDEYLEKFKPFNVTDAISAWDEEHRKAFVTWCENAFWP